MKRNIVIGLVLLLLTACSSNAGSPSSPDERQTQQAGMNLAGTKWSLVSYGKPGVEKPVIEGSSVTLEFDTQGQAGGSGGCNSYGTPYQVQGNTLSFGEITSTLMACEQEGIGEQEQDYFQALKTASKFEESGDSLKIWYDIEQGVLNFAKSSGS